VVIFLPYETGMVSSMHLLLLKDKLITMLQLWL